eukprot:scaffold19932_cov69-Phaeocystis_antarctica.AAC.2
MLLEVLEAGLHLGGLASAQAARHLGQLVEPLLLAKDRDGLEDVSRLEVGLTRHAQVVSLLRPRRLPAHELLRVLRVGVVRELPRLVPPAEVRVHGDGALDAVGLAEELGSLLELAHVREHRGDEHLVVVRRLAPLHLDPAEQLEELGVLEAHEGLARRAEVEALERLLGELPPVLVGDAEARDAVRGGEVLLVEVAVERGALRHVDRLHRHVVQREDLRALEAHDEALHALLVQREVGRLDRERAVAREAEHVVELGVPRDGRGVGLLEEYLAALEVVDGDDAAVVDDGDLAAHGRDVEAADGRAVLEELHRERVVDEDAARLAVGEPDDQPLAPRGAARHLDVADLRVEGPLPLALAAEAKVLCGEHEQVALDRQRQLLVRLDAAVLAALLGQVVDEEPAGQLHRQPVLVDGDLTHVVAALDAHLLLIQHVLHHHVRHEVTVGVALAVEPVHGREE